MHTPLRRRTIYPADAGKVGSFKYIALTPAGLAPAVMVVMALEEGKTAQVIVAGISANGPYWRFITGTVSGNRLDYVPREGGVRYLFDWNDASGGSMTQHLEMGGATKIRNTRFARLDD